MRREHLLGALVATATLGIVCLMAEGALRFLPVATGLRTTPVTASSPVFRFTPERAFVFSRDWDLAMANRGHVNNAGFVNDQDYQKQDSTPVLAVVGDSYIEAAMVRYSDTLHGRLAKAFGEKARVYSFAASGAPLSQYLVWAKHAVQTYGARALIITVVGNDFDESHADYKQAPGFWYYAADGGETLRLRLAEYRPSILRELVYHSALARYLVFNLQVMHLWQRVKTMIAGDLAGADARYAGNTSSAAAPRRVRDSSAAVDAFFRDLPQMTGLSVGNILFVVDGHRYPEAARAAKGSYFDLMRTGFIQKAQSLGYDVLDLDPVFFQHHARTGERFEFPRDGHWSATGHGVVFDAVMSLPFLKRFADAAKQRPGTH